MPVIPFGQYLPDLAALENPGSPTVLNVTPGPSGYRPMPDVAIVSASLTARCQGASAFIDKAATVYNYAGDATKLYQVTPTAVTQVGGSSAYSIASDDIWDSVQYGETAIFTDFADPVQFISLGAASFTALFTSSRQPKARTVAVINEHVVVGMTNDTLSGVQPNRVWFSAQGDPRDMTPSAATLCDNQDLDAEGGWVRRIMGGFEYGLVFQEHAITRMTKTGGADIFQFSPIIKTRGLFGPAAIASIDRMVFFLSEDGFYLCDGVNVTPIGANKVDKTFFNALSASYYYRVSFAVDPVNKQLWVAYPSASATNGNPDKLLVYDWTLQQWAPGEQVVELLFRSNSLGYTLDGLDAVSASLDALTPSLDSRFWTGGKVLLSGFNSSHRMVTFAGAALAATLETGDVQLNPPLRSLVTSVRPIVDGGTLSMALGTRNRPNDAIAYSAAVSQTADGICPFAVDARYHRARVSVAAGGTWTHAQGIDDIQAMPTGAF